VVESVEHVNDSLVYIESGIFLAAQEPSALEKVIRSVASLFLFYIFMREKDIKITVCSDVARHILDKLTDVSKAPVASILLQGKQSSMCLRNVDKFLPDHKMSVLIDNKHHNERHVTIKSRIQYVSSLAA
jgi:hypothetical protein